MSLYIGQSAVNTPLLHVTTGVRSITDLQSAVLSNSYIHPNINYTGYKVFKVSDPSSSYNSSTGMYEYLVTTDDPDVAAFKNWVLEDSSDPKVFVAVVGGYAVGNQAVVEAGFLGMFSTGPILYADSSNSIQSKLQTSTTTLGFTSSMETTDVRFVVFDISASGVDNIQEFSTGIGPVSFVHNDIILNHTALSAIPFITYGEVVNAVDFTITLNNTKKVQLINSTPSTGSLQVTPKKIQVKGKTILDTDKSLAVSTSHSVITFIESFSFSVSDNDIWRRHLGYLSSGDGLYVVSWANGTFSEPTLISVDTSYSTSEIFIKTARIHLTVDPVSKAVGMYTTGLGSGWTTTFAYATYKAMFLKIA